MSNYVFSLRGIKQDHFHSQQDTVIGGLSEKLQSPVVMVITIVVFVSVAALVSSMACKYEKA